MKYDVRDFNAPSRWNMRIWDDDKKEWLCQGDGDALTYYGFDITGGETTEFQGLPKWHPDRHLIWEQSTGLKDKNGKEIYEGDIVEYDWYITSGKPAYRVQKQVVFDDMGARVGNDRIRNCSNVEVIGNIHENPKLLGGEE